MNYLEKFQAEFEAATESYVADVSRLSRQREKSCKRLADERDKRARAEEQIERLNSTAGERTVDRDAFEKFKSSSRRLRSEAQTSADAIEMLQGQVLPDIDRQLADAQRSLEKAASEFFRSMRDRFEQRLQELFNGLLGEADDYFGSCRQLAASAGVRYLPRSLAADIAKIDKYCLRVQEDRVHLGLLPHSSWPKKET